MAGHLPVKNTMFRLALLTEAIKELNKYERIEFYKKLPIERFTKYNVMVLPVEDYEMNDEHGLIDETVIAITREEDILEYHLDKDEKINAIYLVM